MRISLAASVTLVLLCCHVSGIAAPVLTNNAARVSRAHDPDSASSAERDYQLALKAIVDGDLDAAERSFTQALKRDPQLAKAMLGLAEIAFKRRRLELAAQWIERAVVAQPLSSEVQASSGRLLALQGKYQAAEAALNKAIELDAKAVRPLVDLGDLVYSRGDLAGAATAYQRALSLDPQHAGAHYALGLTLVRLGEPSKAKFEFDQAAKLDVRNPLPSLALARLYASRNEHATALSSVDRALALQPGLVDALMLRAELLAAQGQLELAQAEYKKAAQAVPQLAAPHLRLGMLAQRGGQFDLALSAYKKAIELDPTLAVAFNNLAALSVERKLDLAQAETWANRAVALQPKAADFLDTLGWVQRARGKAQTGLASLQKAASLAPNSAEILYHLGMLYAETGDKSRAADALKQALAKPGSFSQADDARRLLSKLQP